jgi:hypothetical protein
MCSLFYGIFRPYIYHHCHLSSLRAAAVFFDIIHNNCIQCSPLYLHIRTLQLSIDFASPDLNRGHLMTFWTCFDIIFSGMLQLTILSISFDEDDYTSIYVWKDHLSGCFPPLLHKVHLKSFGHGFATCDSGSGSDSESSLDGSELPSPRSNVSIRNCLSMLF